MFAPLSRFRHRQPDPSEVDRAFVQELRVEHSREPRSRRSERVLVICWVLVLAKCAFIYWACHHFPQAQAKLNPWWLIVPTLIFATLCTLIYWRRD